MRGFVGFALVLIGLSLVTAPLRAEPQTHQFEVRLFGFPVGALGLTEQQGAKGYSASAEFRTKGLAGALRKVGFVMQTRGRVVNGRLDPRRYSENVNTGERQSSGTTVFTPQDKRIDPLTALLIGVAARGPKEGCAENVLVFDGKRTHRFTMQTTTKTPERLVCRGAFMREKGYSPAQLKQLKGYQFTAIYEKRDSGYTFSQGKASTLHGPVTIHRQ